MDKPSAYRPPLYAGDVVCVRGGMPVISAGIRLAELIWSHDNEADYGHSFIVADDHGGILDTLWTVSLQQIDRYKGEQMIIARPMRTLTGIEISPLLRGLAFDCVRRSDLGRWYPVHRLGLHLLPPLAKYISSGNQLVCSERTAKYLYIVGARPWTYSGVTPDTLADEWRVWHNFDVIFEGTWPDANL